MPEVSVCFIEQNNQYKPKTNTTSILIKTSRYPYVDNGVFCKHMLIIIKTKLAQSPYLETPVILNVVTKRSSVFKDNCLQLDIDMFINKCW